MPGCCWRPALPSPAGLLLPFVLSSLASAKVGAGGGGGINRFPVPCLPLRRAGRRVPGLFSPRHRRVFVPSLLPPPSRAAVRPGPPREPGASPEGAEAVLREVRVGSGLPAPSGGAPGWPPPASCRRTGWGVVVSYNSLWKCGMLNFPLLDTRPWGPGEVTSPQSCPLASAQRCPRRLAAGRRATSLQLPSAGFPIHRH